MARYTQQPRLDTFKSFLVDGARFSARYELPMLAKSASVPEKATPFHKTYTAKEHKQWVHFFIYDVRFECVWNNPMRYLPMLQSFDGVITPDFSLSRDLPLPMQIWNNYRNRALAYWLSKNGVSIVPNVSWGDERSYDFAFEGIEPGSTVAVSTNGCIQEKDDRYFFKQGLAKMVEVLQPKTIINYSMTPEDIFGEYRGKGIHIVEIENEALAVRRAVR